MACRSVPINDCEVAIVGAGPVGLTLANLLGGYGVRTLVLERELHPVDQPRAVSLDDESLRIWQQCGLIDDILPFVAEGAEGDVVFTYRDRRGRELFSLTEHGRPYGYARGNVFLFHRVLQVLGAGLDRFPSVAVHTGWTARYCRPRGDAGVTLELYDNSGVCHEINAEFLVGCDGGRSTIRDALQIPMRGKAYAESWLIVDTRCPELGGQRPGEGVEVWCDARCPTASIPLPDGYRRWEFLLRRGRDPADSLDDASLRTLIAARKDLGEYQIVRRLVHTYKATVAETYGRGRIFLAGDAAHLSPPFAGQGMATGLRDAANLAWKLTHVLRGYASRDLLASYEQERRPHQLKMLGLARRMGAMMMPKVRLQELAVAVILRLFGKLPALRARMEIRGANITPVYGAKGWRTKAGQYLIQPEIGGGRLFDDLLGDHYTIIAFGRDPRDLMDRKEWLAWECCKTSFVCLAAEGETLGAYQAFDRWLEGCRGRLLIVRPDRFVLEDRRMRGAVPATHPARSRPAQLHTG